ncbi:PREDICTED: proline-rich receptor-like protein kinase PERK10 [Camelina sativa]|uniref:Proline-rich receptor-like protein kinase PERK10 n=1 Tax=Camelina sativa TaxID=90675 RepID=A0ABM0TYG9_CAMSA|nr:PREDICTED: proline-rich receptor-like protein kinase PERK10 [Camelina sativa]
MGCCFSAGKVTAPPPVAAAQIPPPIEEESVKEVVVQSVSVSVPLPISVPVQVPDIVPSAPEVISDSEPQVPHPLSPPPAPEISQSKSDICSVSVSHSYSTATTATAASILEDDALSKPHRPLPPPSSTSRRNRPDRVLRSPGERHSPQGGKQLRPRLVRERQSRQPNPTHNRRNADSGPLPRSGLSDNHPRRRSQSPATRGPSAARRSPMKKRVGAPEKDGATTEVKKEEVEKVAVEVKKEEDGEAVKDPEVSMECFIFL